MSIFTIISHAHTPLSIDEDIKLFKKIYTEHSINDWLNTNLIFEVGNYIAYNRPDLVSIGIRLNVQVNLFLRTIKTYSSNYESIFNKIGHDLGCFALTETKAGVLSGLIIDTKFSIDNDDIIIEDGEKQYISQGIYAQYGLIFTANKNNDKDVRICLVKMNENGIEKTQMNVPFVKTLDLALIKLNKVYINKDNILDLTQNKTKMEVLNGILYGRFMITTAVIYSILGLIHHIRNNIKNDDKFKQLAYDEYIDKLDLKVNNYITILEKRQKKLLETLDVFLINCYKVHVVEECIKIFNDLHLKFGVRASSYNLKYETLILNKVAEGDTSVLRLAIINNHIKKGYYNILINDGFSFYEILKILFSCDNKFILKNFKKISDNIIKSNI